MPTWAIIALIAGLILVVAGFAAAVWFGWRAYERKQLLRLIGKLEAVESTAQALIDSIGRLSEVSDEELETFLTDIGAPERRILAEVHGRAHLYYDELDHMPLPKRLAPIAEGIADAAYVVAREADCISDKDTGDAALDKLATVDLEAVTGYTAQARTRLSAMCAVCGLEDMAVYGGGLYL